MRVVDEDLRAARMRADKLQPAARALQVGERGERLLRIDAGRDRERGGDERVRYLELADERQRHVVLLAERLDQQARAVMHARGGDELQRLALAARR